MTARPLVCVFVKYPEPGRVKTRLAREIGAEAAARLYRAFVEDLVDRLAGEPAWALGLAVDPAWPLEDYRRWLPHVDRMWEQPVGDLGTRMAAAVQRARDEGWAPVVLLGGDTPHLPLARIHEAVSTLQAGAADLVLGPARDGGYYLIAMRRPLPVFHGIAWSTPAVLRQTLDRAQAAGTGAGPAPGLLPEESDIDTLEDWRQVMQDIEGGAIDPSGLPRTRQVAREMGLASHP